ALKHQDLPFETLVEHLNPKRFRELNPLAQIAFAFQNTPRPVADWGALQASHWPQEIEAVRFDLEVHAFPTNTGFEFAWIYNCDLWDAETVERMSRHFHVFLRNLAATPDCAIADVPMVENGELRKLRAWSAGASGYASNETIVDLFERQAGRTPEDAALVFEKQSLCYRDLNTRANRLAHRLIGLGVVPDSLVGLCMERTSEMAIGLLAILKAGGAYVPLDPHLPCERLKFMTEDAGIKLILTDESSAPRLTNFVEERTLLNVKPAAEAEGRDVNPSVAVRPDHLAYVIYTSGSTGRPKGVAMPHEALHNLVIWHHDSERLSNPAKTLQFASTSFDVSFQEMFTTWTVGGSLFLASDSIRLDPHALLSFLQEAGIERLFLPVVMLQQLADVAKKKDLPALRDVVTAGERLEATPAIREFFSTHPSRLHNHYGPTETHVVTSCLLSEKAAEWPEFPPIGRPISNLRIFILDANLQLLPIGVPGELCIAGAGLARTYLNRPEITAERFTVLPGRRLGLDHDKLVRLYRSGDRALWRTDGQLEFLGRIDQQIKLRGFRIEPGEIETILCRLPTIKEAIVVLRDDRSGGPYLAAYLVGDNQAPPPSSELRRELAEQLPEYMIPSAFVVLNALPLTSSGKIDRKALPAPEPDRVSLGTPYSPPRSPMELQLAAIWQADLHLGEAPGVHDSFFDLGGHSMLSAQLLAHIEEKFGYCVPLNHFYTNPTIAGLAELLEQSGTAIAKEADTAHLNNSASSPPVSPLRRPRLEPIRNKLLNFFVSWHGPMGRIKKLVEQPDALNAEEADSPQSDTSESAPPPISSPRWPLPEPLRHKLLSYFGSWRGTRTHSCSLIVGRNTEGNRTPLFWVFQGENEWTQLANYLDSEQPLYGMRSGHLIMEYSEDNIQALALAYVEEILALTPDGPLFIGGNCQAGIIAEAIAQHLWRRRRQVPLLFLMEWSFPFHSYPGPVALIFGRESEVANPNLRFFRHPELAWQRHFKNFRVEYIPGEHGKFFNEPNVQGLAETVTRLMNEALQQPRHHFSGKPIDAKFTVIDPPDQLQTDSDFLLAVRLRNAGPFAWTSLESCGLMLASRWLTSEGEILSSRDGRSPLPPLAPGESSTLNLFLHTPALSGRVLLQLVIIEEGVRWHDGGPGTLELNINLAPPVSS
ncbi:MAG: non-ribosomal peptide synthetase, partial [Gammaproteobacteria bacterium]